MIYILLCLFAAVLSGAAVFFASQRFVVAFFNFAFMEFKRLDKRKGSGAASIRSRYAYLIHLPDIDYFPETNEKGVRLEGDIVLQEGRTMIPVYLTNPSQEYSYDTPGNDDEKTFLVKFVGTHPGTELEALEFSKNLLEEPFLVLIPGCEKNAPGKLLGQPNNPMIFTSTHKASKDGDKFNFNFEQRVGSEFIYFSYGGIISLPPGGDDPDIPVPPSPGFDPTKWARRDASNIDGDNVLLWREALRIYNENKLLTLGAITATTTSIDLAVHSSGVNSVQLDGEVLSKSTPDHWDFAEVTAEEVFIIYATNSTEIFHLAENGMEIPADALIVATITISETGTSIDEAVSGFREKAIDKWANLMTAGGDIVLSLHHNQMRYRVSSSASDVRIGGFKNYVTDLLYSGIPLSIKNNTEGDIEFFNAVDESPLFIPIYSADLPFKIKKGETANFAWHTDNGFEIVKTGGGASFPETGNNGDVLVKDSSSGEGAVWSGRLTAAEGAITTEKNRNDAQDVAINNKVDKPTTDGIWSLQKLGSVFTWVSGVIQNIANTDLSNISARIFTQGNTFVWDTVGFKYSLKNIVSSIDIASVLVRNSAQEVESATVVELLVENGTTTVITSANLDTIYPTAIIGFEVICPNVNTANYPNGLIYKKYSTGWKAIKLDNV